MPRTAPRRKCLPIVLVHGAWHGSWCWEPVARGLSAQGIDVRLVDLPFTGLDQDVAEVHRALATIDDGAILCGHSYGGRVVSVAAQGMTKVHHLVYIAAPMLRATQVPEYVQTFERRAPPAAFEALDFETARSRFYGECPDEVARHAYGLLRPMATRPPLTLGLDARPWESIPSTYVVCANDGSVFSSDLQRSMAMNATHVAEIDADHSPFLSRPDALSVILRSLARAGCGEPASCVPAPPEHML